MRIRTVAFVMLLGAFVVLLLLYLGSRQPAPLGSVDSDSAPATSGSHDHLGHDHEQAPPELPAPDRWARGVVDVPPAEAESVGGRVAGLAVDAVARPAHASDELLQRLRDCEHGVEAAAIQAGQPAWQASLIRALLVDDPNECQVEAVRHAASLEALALLTAQELSELMSRTGCDLLVVLEDDRARLLSSSDGACEPGIETEVLSLILGSADCLPPPDQCRKAISILFKAASLGYGLEPLESVFTFFDRCPEEQEYYMLGFQIRTAVQEDWLPVLVHTASAENSFLSMQVASVGIQGIAQQFESSEALDFLRDYEERVYREIVATPEPSSRQINRLSLVLSRVIDMFHDEDSIWRLAALYAHEDAEVREKARSAALRLARLELPAETVRVLVEGITPLLCGDERRAAKNAFDVIRRAPPAEQAVLVESLNCVKHADLRRRIGAHIAKKEE